jgi:hypothetical protein
LKIAIVPAERQEEALTQCFGLCFATRRLDTTSSNRWRSLRHWSRRPSVSTRSEDTQVLLPALAQPVVPVEQERDALLALSTLHFHPDKTNPKPNLAKSWNTAEGLEAGGGCALR